ncbi:MAG: prolyl oligopeptidase family serine peptidase [Dehalococcoidia bacterium]|nr:prolyl oligopeptidase family serine peptidase [Dehalococcoidia bacterium]
MTTEAPYGSWKSPVTADLIVSATVGIGQPMLDGGDVYWTEVRPMEAGRSVIVRRRPDGSIDDLIAAPISARARVHEYGGGEFVVRDGAVYFSNFADQRIYRVRAGSAPEPLTHAEGMRYADAVVDAARNRLICVREDHSRADREAVNTIAAVDLTSGGETVLVQGADFYAYPRLSSDGSKLAWIAWDHPNMPWDGTELRVAEVDAAGALGESALVAGGRTESIFQPQWPADGELHFVSDRGGWWNLYRWPGLYPGLKTAAEGSPDVEVLAARKAEFGRPLWQFGAATYDFDTEGRIVCAYCERGMWRLATLDGALAELTDIETPFSDIRGLRVGGGKAYFIGGSATRMSGLVALDLASGEIETVRASSEARVDEGYVSAAETIEFPTEAGLTAHGFFYPPRNRDFSAPSGEKPPLLVMSHGGPTSATSPTLSLRTQFWTSRGIAVLDVNYGGSTGYGREYRQRLDGRWGIVDVDDCVSGARYLAGRGLADGERLAITGGSAGGYTTLCALAFRDAFKAGASHFGVGDLEALARDTHKFESRYLDGLVGPYPGRRDIYVERSPIHHVERLACPVIFFQGLDDPVVPPNQAETMVEALRAKGVPVAYVAFEGEQHGFRRAPNIKRSLEAELYFYSRVFGFELGDAVEPVAIDNLPSN